MLFKDFPYYKEHDAGALKRAEKWLVERTPEFSGRANFGVFFKDKEHDKSYLRQGCHGSIAMCPGAECVATENRARLFKTKYVVDWLLDESWASGFILNKDDKKMCYERGVIVTAHMPLPLLQNILIAFRFEHGEDKLLEFERLAKEGYPRSLVWNIVFGTAWERGSPSTCWGVNTHGSPTLLAACMKTVKNILNGDMGAGHKTKTYFLSNGYKTYYGGMDYWKPSAGSHYPPVFFPDELFKTDAEYKKGLLAYRGGDLDKMVVINPFKSRPPSVETRPERVSFKEMEEYVLPYLKEKGYFDGVPF